MHVHEWQASLITVVLSVAGLLLGWVLFRRGTAPAEQPAGPVVTAARRNLYADVINSALFELPGKVLSRALVYFDNRGLDGLVNGLAAMTGGSSSRLRRTQTGYVRTYAVSMLGGAVLVVAALLVVYAGQY